MTPEQREWLAKRQEAKRKNQALISGPPPGDNAAMEGQATDDQALLDRVQAKTRELYGPSVPVPERLSLECDSPVVRQLAMTSGDWLDFIIEFRVNGAIRQVEVRFPAMELVLYRLTKEAIGAVTERVAKAILAELSRK